MVMGGVKCLSCMFLLAFLSLTVQRHRLNLFSHNLLTKGKGLCTVRELPAYTAAPSLTSLPFAGYRNQSPLLTIEQLARARMGY